jgi:hypothetical protein
VAAFVAVAVGDLAVMVPAAAAAVAAGATVTTLVADGTGAAAVTVRAAATVPATPCAMRVPTAFSSARGPVREQIPQPTRSTAGARDTTNLAADDRARPIRFLLRQTCCGT